MSIAQPRFVEIKFTRKFDFWEASRALRAKKAPKYAIERYAQKRSSKYAVEPYAQKRLPKYAIEPYVQKSHPSTL